MSARPTTDPTLRVAGLIALAATAPLLWFALRALAERDYVGGALLVFAGAAIGHLGLELLALSTRPAGGES